MSYKAWVAKQKGSQLEWVDWDPVPLGDHDVEVEITHCGLCHTDKHLVDNDWGVTVYPHVAGHEGVGFITKVGTAVSQFKVGERVGVAWIQSSCGACKNCLKGEENLCLKGYTPMVTTVYAGPTNNGCFGKRVRVDAKLVAKIPEKLDSVDVAPLLCAGITVFVPIREHVEPGMQVGVIGIGGLGHLAIQFARAFGAEVTAFSTTPEKEAEAKSFGAHHFVSTSDEAAMKKAENSLDVVLHTSSASIDWGKWLGNGWPAGILRNGGKLIVMGLPTVTIPVPVVPLVFGGKQVIGSVVGGSKYMKDMLDFAQLHNIKPKTEVIDFKNINEAIDKVVANKARYRIVLKH